MDHESSHMTDPHIPHGAPLTPQLTPVSLMGGNMTPVVPVEGETIKTEVSNNLNLNVNIFIVLVALSLLIE